MTPQVISLSAAGSTAWIPVDYKQNPFNIDVAVVLSNTPNLTYKVEYTLDDVFNPAITPTAFSHATLVGLTANGQAPITSPVRAIRLTITAWTSGTATMTALQGAVNPTIYTTQGGVQVLQFPGFRKSLLASLVLTSTASRTSNIVTITATGHGIPTGAAYVGFRYFYPGSPSLVAGWYDSIVSIPNANTITFNASGTDFGSESVNAAAIYTTLTDVASVTIPASKMQAGTQFSLIGYQGGDTTASSKQMRTYVNTLNVHTHSTTAQAFVRFQASNVLAEGGKSYGHSGFDNISSSTEYIQNITFGVDGTFLVKASVSTAASFIYIPTLDLVVY